MDEKTPAKNTLSDADTCTDRQAGSIHALRYVETVLSSAEEALGLLRAYVAGMRTSSASSAVELLRRIDRPHHFAILEHWSSETVLEGHRAGKDVAAFHASLAPLLVAPIDDRRHAVLSAANSNVSDRAIWVIAHIDIIPPQLEQGLPQIARLSETSRLVQGNRRFDALSQKRLPNHVLLVQAWCDEAALWENSAAAHSRSFRQALLPIIGSPFDERLFRQAD